MTHHGRNAMITAYLPVYAKEEFETFKRILGPDCPDTYDLWRKLVLDRAKMIAGDGDVSVAVTIHPDEFTVWMTAHRGQTNLQALDALADFKGRTGQRD
jgi:hypothetical protein